VEGYTDDRPISTVQFHSNWELSAARAASVVHAMIADGIRPNRLAVVGYGEYQPIADNSTEPGRNANRRVLLVILAAPAGPDAVPATGPTIALEPAPAPEQSDTLPAKVMQGGNAPVSSTHGARATSSITASDSASARNGARPDIRTSVATDAAPQPGAG
jgi:chemotaxis protein MotB